MASLIYHLDWLSTNLPPIHPIRNCLAFNSGRLREWQDNVACGRGSNTDTGMIATGIPQNVMISEQVDKLVSRVIVLERNMERRSHDTEEYLENLMTRLPAALEERITTRFEINGAVHLTREDLERQQSNIVDRVMSLLDQRLQPRNPLVEERQEENIADHVEERFQFWHYEGRLHRVPDTFEFRSLATKSLWDFWHFGDTENHICPYKHLNQNDLPNIRRDAKKLIKARRVIKEIKNNAVVDNVWPSNATIESLGMPTANRIFQDGYDRLLSKIEEGKRRRNQRFMDFRRDEEIQFVIIYNDMRLGISRFSHCMNGSF